MTRRRLLYRLACTWSRPRRPASSSPGTRWPATRPSTVTRCGAATRRAAPTRRWRSWPARPATWTARSPKARPTTTWCARWMPRSTARATRRRYPRPRQLRTVTLNFNVTVPATTDATGRSVYIAGFLDRLDGDLPQWNPGGVVLTRADATHWTITLTGKETTQIEYKYALGIVGLRREGCELRRDRQPPAHAQLRRHRHADRQRYRAQLAKRGALRQLINGAAE